MKFALTRERALRSCKEKTMKKVLFVLLLAAATASAQVYPPDASSGTATSVSPSAFPLLAPDGTSAAPSYSFTNNADAGIYILGTTIYLQNQDTLTGGRAYAQFGGEVATIHATLGADTGNFGQFSCQQNTDMYCFVNTTDGVNTSSVNFTNTNTQFSDPIYLPDGAAATPSLTFTSDTNAGLYAFGGTGVALSNASGAEAARIYDNFAGLRSANGSDTAEFQAQGNYLSSGDPIFIVKVWDAGNTAQNDFWCTHRDADEGCHLGVDDGTNASDVRFHPTYTSFTDPVLLPTGTAANPALAYSGDADNGIVLGIGTWDLATATSGNSRSYVQLDGNAGTGTPIITIGANDGATDISNFSCSAWSELCQVNITDGTNSSTATFYDDRTEFSDPVLTPQGTSANKAIALSTDPDNGISFQTNTMYIETSTNATQYAHITMDGTGGIGQPSISISANNGSGKTAGITAQAYSPNLSITTNNGTDNSSVSLGPTTVELDADGDNGGNGTITLTTGNDTMQTVLSANSFAVSGDDGTSDTADLDLTTTGNNPIFKAAIVAAGGADVALTFQGPSTGQALFDIDGSTHDIRGSFIDFDFDDTDSIVEFYFDDNEFRLGQNVTQEFEGATNDGNETVLTVEDPTADRTVTLPDETGYVDANQRGTSTLTDNTATSLLLFALADTEFAYGSITIQTYCEGGSDMVGTHEEYDFVCHNDGDAEDCAFGVKTGTKPVSGTGAANITTHTLTATYQTNQVTFQLQADCSLTPTTLEGHWEISFHHGGVWKAVTEQN